MHLPVPSARYLGADDTALVTQFRCSTGPWFEARVERFIGEELSSHHDWRAAHTDHTIIGLETADAGLIAVTTHEEDLVRDEGAVLTSSYWEVAAVAAEFQGAVLPEVAPLDPDGRAVTVGRYLAEVALSDMATRDREPVIRAVVARGNVRSLALCDRIGLVRRRVDADPAFIQRWGRMPVTDK